ncbi:MAG TPA: MarR family transcriptional regulator [Longimicrobiales bacterium]
MDDQHRSLQSEIQQTRPFRSPAQEAIVAVLRTADVLRRRFAAVVEPYGITPQQYNVLRILRGARGKPMCTLAIGSRLIEQAPGITRLLDRLEKKGLVRRERCAEDRREVHCFITQAGLELLERLDRAMDDAEDAAVGELGADELEMLCDSLAHIRAAE